MTDTITASARSFFFTLFAIVTFESVGLAISFVVAGCLASILVEACIFGIEVE